MPWRTSAGGGASLRRGKQKWLAFAACEILSATWDAFRLVVLADRRGLKVLSLSRDLKNS